MALTRSPTFMHHEPSVWHSPARPPSCITNLLHGTPHSPNPRLPEPPRGGGPLARQRATRTSRAERVASARILLTLHPCGGASPHHRPAGARRGTCAGAREG